jgi:MoaA/NifB/PqqE/SkfB family radical SAM enzyme
MVIDNIKRLIEAKRNVCSNRPEIVWQFLVNKFNEHEIATAEEVAKELRITLDLRPLDISDNLVDVELETTIDERKDYWLAKNKKYICEQYKKEAHYPVFNGICTELFTDFAVTVDGKVLPCCGSWDKKNEFGDLLTESFRDIWFNEKYVNSRMRFFKKNFQPKVKTICFRCNNYGTSSSLMDILMLLKAICSKNFHHLRRRLSSFRRMTRLNLR